MAEIVCCQCVSESDGERDRRLLRWSGTPPTYEDATFDTFQALRGTEGALVRAKEFASGRQRVLILTGDVGVGKTHLAVAASRARAGLDGPFVYVNVPAFLDRLRQSYSNKSQWNEREIMEPAQRWPVCILDDLGAQRSTDWALERLYALVDARYSQGLATIVTTNCLPSEWESRIMSRLTDKRYSVTCNISAQDYRRTA